VQPQADHCRSNRRSRPQDGGAHRHQAPSGKPDPRLEDDQVGHHTPELLRQDKHEREGWIAGLGESNGPTRLIPDPTYPIPKTLRICMIASTLWNLMGDAHIFYPSWPDGLSEEQHDLIADFLDDLRDWRGVASIEDSYRVGRDASKHLETIAWARQQEKAIDGQAQLATTAQNYASSHCG
jgi:hypothetical protein